MKKNKEKAAIVMLLQQYREYKEYKDVLFNDKCIKHSKNTIQSYENRIVTYEISKIWLSCFHEKIYMQSNGYNGLALGY